MTIVPTESIPRELAPEYVFVEACKRNEQVAVSPYLAREKWGERVLAGLMLVPALPVIGALLLLIRCTSKGPGLFKQRRVGKNGKVYIMYKLRSMRSDAEDETGPVWSGRQDARTTFVGSLLRKAHLDELPQLWNVLKGEMSLVGPRPERPEFVSVLEEKVPGYCDRLRVLPGVTGLAQVNLPPDTSLASVRDKVALDVEYVQTADMLVDSRIIICTMLKMFCIPSRIRVRLTGVNRRMDHNGDDVDATVAVTPDHLRRHGHNGRHRDPSSLPHRPR
jgi:lipopolysaccharide/colanic/teichoic acid biosynthesis glycosyltransferase